jgi:prepilin-type N-terminal cleavage/methylation domain-containing protein
MGVKIETEDGFSVVELLITLIIIGIFFSAFTLAFTSIQGINKKANDVIDANQIAFSKMQEYENKSFPSITTTVPTGSLVEIENFSGSLPTKLEAPRVGKVYINTISPTLKQVIITVEFGSGSAIRRVQYGNFIQAQGIGR